jgi:hypothetical protein
MNSQNILKFYGSKLDLKLDSSELYDFEMGGVENDYDISLLDFTTSINYDSLVIDSDCLTGTTINDIKPWIIEIDEDNTIYNCDFNVRRRTETGWTLDFVFNRNNLHWEQGFDFYYWGVNSFSEYKDNFLRFSFGESDEQGIILWQEVKMSGYCDTVSGFTTTTVNNSGQTNLIPTGETLNDFNITITFERYKKYESCDLSNEGGWNDLITGVTILNPMDIITGATEDVSYFEVLNEKWWNERSKRLGVLKIYLNGKLFYKKENFEEVIPSLRENGNKIIQVVGGGFSGLTETHFEILNFKYYEEPLNFLQINHHYIVDILSNYDVPNNSPICEFGADDLIGYTDQGLLTEIEENLLTEDNNILLY